MKSIITQKNFPLFFLVLISLFWSYYYSGEHWFNDYGQQKGELWLLIECFITIPLVCFYCYWHDIKTALLKSVVYISLIILLGSFIIPSENKVIWLYLESARYVLLMAFVVLEITAIITVALAIKSTLNSDQDPDQAIETPLLKVFGDSFAAGLLTFEARVWTYVLLNKKINADNFEGEQHFTVHNKDGTQSNLLGFIMIIAFELPIVHMLLHFIWSPMAANVISLLTFLSLLWFIAEYRAIAKRPVSITNTGLIIRYGLFNTLTLKHNEILSIAQNIEPISRDKSHKRYNSFGVPNVVIHLKESPQRSWNKVYLGLDDALLFIEAYQESYQKLY